MNWEQIDYDSVLWDLEQVALFFRAPLKVRLPGKSETFSVGSGLGGLHWSLFSRGFPCISCGMCCHTDPGKIFNRRLWFWWASEPHPDAGVFATELEINGVAVPIRYHISADRSSCDYLRADKPKLCSIYQVRPAHCMATLGNCVMYRVGKDRMPMLSRRKPSRNWRWPKCPAQVYTAPRTKQDIENDLYLFGVWKQNLAQIPGCVVREAEALYVRNLNQPARSLLFKDFV